jgi:hypothetical protein
VLLTTFIAEVSKLNALVCRALLRSFTNLLSDSHQSHIGICKCCHVLHLHLHLLSPKLQPFLYGYTPNLLTDTRILLTFLLDPSTRPLSHDMKLWVDMLRYIKQSADKRAAGGRGGAGALGFFTYMELSESVLCHEPRGLKEG